MDEAEKEQETKDEFETKQFLVTVTVKKGFSQWDVMRIAEDRAWYAEGIENFDYDEYDAI